MATRKTGKPARTPRSKRLYDAGMKSGFKTEWAGAACSLEIVQDLLREQITPDEAKRLMRGLQRWFRAHDKGRT